MSIKFGIEAIRACFRMMRNMSLYFLNVAKSFVERRARHDELGFCFFFSKDPPCSLFDTFILGLNCVGGEWQSTRRVVRGVGHLQYLVS